MTSYEKVYGRFLNSTTDFHIVDLDDNTLHEMLKEFLHSSIAKVRTSSDLSHNETDDAFINSLSDLDIELLAMGMRLAWLDQRINSTEYTNLFVGGKEEKFYSPSSQLAELRALRSDTLREMQQLYTYDTYVNNSYFD